MDRCLYRRLIILLSLGMWFHGSREQRKPNRHTPQEELAEGTLVVFGFESCRRQAMLRTASRFLIQLLHFNWTEPSFDTLRNVLSERGAVHAKMRSYLFHCVFCPLFLLVSEPRHRTSFA